MNRTLRKSTPIVALVAALALVLGQAAVFAHFASGDHAGLVPGGQDLDFVSRAPRAAAPHAAPLGPGLASAEDAPSATHACSFETLLRERVHRAAAAFAAARSVERPRACAAPAAPDRAQGLPRILLAPKNSPPSA